MITNTITTSGIGVVKVAPDYMAVRIQVESHGASYQEAYDKMEENHKLILGIFRDLQLNRSLIRLSALQSTHPQVYQDKKVYSVSQEIVYKQKINIEEGRELLHALRKVADFAITIDFYLKDDTAAESEALVLAVNNATDKAKAMVSASGVKLGSIVQMEQLEGEAAPVFLRTVSSSSYNESAKSIRIQKSVKIIWELK